MMCVGVVRIQQQCAPELTFRARPIQLVVENQGQRGVSFSGFGIDLNGLERRCIGLWKRLRRGVEAVPCESATAIRQYRTRCAVVWIFIYCPLEIGCCLLHALCSPLVPVIASFEIGLIR